MTLYAIRNILFVSYRADDPTLLETPQYDQIKNIRTEKK